MIYTSVDTSKPMTGVVYVHADWCSSCEEINKFMKDFYEDMSEVCNFYFLNADDFSTEVFMESHNIESVPFFGVIVENYMLSGHVGFVESDQDKGRTFVEDFKKYAEIVFS